MGKAENLVFLKCQYTNILLVLTVILLLLKLTNQKVYGNARGHEGQENLEEKDKIQVFRLRDIYISQFYKLYYLR